MPVLISAAAIQLTFGLKKYLLPNFKFIHIYPKEFLRVQPTICYWKVMYPAMPSTLAGNIF